MSKGGKKLSDMFLSRGMDMNVNASGNGTSNNIKSGMSSFSSVRGAFHCQYNYHPYSSHQVKCFFQRCQFCQKSDFCTN